MRVGLFITCFNDTLFPETGRATVEVLERLEGVHGPRALEVLIALAEGGPA
jgi:Fe-S oxidoreductase